MTETRTTKHYQTSLLEPAADPNTTSPQIKAPLLSKLKEANLTNVCIFSGAGVDPDGLASQAMMEAILIEKLAAKNVSSFYRGTFNRPQNKIIRQVLNLNPKSESEFVSEQYTCIISVDGAANVCPVKPDFIIDHHDSNGNDAKIASDIRLVGACSSIMLEYALESGFDFNTENGQRLATALAMGIKTDTLEGAADKACELDFTALAFCLIHRDNKLYKEVARCPLPSYYRDLYVIGWNNKIIEGSILVTGIGSIPMARSGVISYLADEFVDTDSINTAVVFAIVDGSIDISVRSKNTALAVPEFVRNAFGGTGGGKIGAGRIAIQTTLFENIPDDLSKELFEACFKIVKHKAFQTAGDKK